MRSCKDLPNKRKGEDGECEFGSWLCALAVRTLEEEVVVCKEEWNEAPYLTKKASESSPGSRSPEMTPEYFDERVERSSLGTKS